MAQTLKFGNGTWATKKDSILAYNDENENYKPLPFNYTGAGKGTRVNKEGLIEVVENDRPRIDYLDSEDGVFLLEKAATNLITYSEDFASSYWLKVNNVTVSAEKVISPDGTLNASQLIFDGTSAGRIEKGLTGVISGSDYTVSVYARVSSGTQIVRFGSVADFEYTLTTEWQRLTSTQPENDTTAYPRFRCDDAATIEVWGFQLEQNSHASSYIPTQGSIQTRVQETASGSGNSEVFNDSEGVLFANIATNANDGTSRQLSLSSGSSATNKVSLNFAPTSNQLQGFIRAGGSISFNETITVSDLTNFNKIVLKYKTNDFALWVNGFEIVTDIVGNAPTGLNVLDFDDADGTSDFYGKTKEIGYYDTALTDLELETLTSYRTWKEMVKELNLNVIYNG